MAGLKELRTRIEAIKSTKKITSAMKMVAAAGLRRAQGLIGKSSAYYESLLRGAQRVAFDLKQDELTKGITFDVPALLTGTGEDKNYLLIVISSDKGLCGSYNAHVARAAGQRIKELEAEGKAVKLICIGKKARDILKSRYAELIVQSYEGIARKGADFDEAVEILHPILKAFEAGEYDKIEIVSSFFISAISCETKSRPFLPAVFPEVSAQEIQTPINMAGDAFYDYEPEKTVLLDALLIMLVKAQMFNALVQAQASEQGARMASMDNATRNASDMISKLTLRYNGIRQSAITTELTEIISGAEAI